MNDYHWIWQIRIPTQWAAVLAGSRSGADWHSGQAQKQRVAAVAVIRQGEEAGSALGEIRKAINFNCKQPAVAD
jgi:hypothetical protein